MSFTTTVSGGLLIQEPIDVQLRIVPAANGRFGMEIRAFGQSKDFLVDMTQGDLVKLNKRLQKTLERVVHTSPEPEVVDLALARENLQELAKEGWHAFRKIFPDPQAQDLVRTLLADAPGRIEITSECFYVPWELIYPTDPRDAVSAREFWGFRHVLSRGIPRNFSARFLEPGIKTVQPRVGLLLYNALRAAVQVELPYFQALHADGIIVLEKLAALDPERHEEGLSEVVRFFNQDRDIVHFGCHAVVEDEGLTRARMLIAEEFPLFLDNLEDNLDTICGAPLVILNACNTGKLNPLYTADFTTALLQRGARGVVATDCAVPDGLAAVFAQRLHDELMKGQRLGASLLAVRLDFLEELGNPFGLLYSMYAHPDVRIIRTN